MFVMAIMPYCMVMPYLYIVNHQTILIMAKLGNTIATLLAGAAVGVAVGYLLATDKDKRQDDLEKLKKGLNNIKDKFGKQVADQLEEDIYHT
jgi:hypothetical protein